MSGVEIKRTNNTHIDVKLPYTRRLTVDYVLWFAREAQKAVDAGMPLDTEVKLFNSGGTSFEKKLEASHTIVQDIP